MSQAIVFGTGGILPGTFVQTLTGNSGGAVPPSAGGNINILGSGSISVAGNAGTNTLTISFSGGTVVNSITGDSGGAQTGAITLTGGTTGLTFAGAAGTITLGGTLVVANGGTGISTTTAFAPIIGGTTATGAFQVPSGGAGTAGQILVSAGASAVPVWQANTGGFTWSVITGDQTAAVNNGYFCNKGSALSLALPAASAVGDRIRVNNINTALGILITQAASQQIFIGNTNTTSGATGTLQSSALGDSLELVCSTANLTWRVVSMIGNWTVV